MDICQIGYDICEFDSLRGLGIDIIGRVHFDNRDKFAIWMGSIGKATEPCQQTSGCWHRTFDSFLNLDMGDDTNTTFLLLRVQTTYMTYKMRGDCWGTWLVMLGFMDLGWPRVCRRSTSVLLSPACLLVSLNAEVLVVAVVVGCVQGSWSQVSTFSCYSHCLPLTQNASNGVSE